MISLSNLVLGDHGFGSGRFFHMHFAPLGSPADLSGHNEVEVRQLADEVEETAADDLVQHLIDMMADPL